jgi:hypothetical protein
MKRMKKFASLLLALAMVMSCVVVASAATTYKIESGTLTGPSGVAVVDGTSVTVSLTGLPDNAAGGKTIVFEMDGQTKVTAGSTGTLTGYTITGHVEYAGTSGTFTVAPTGGDSVGTINLDVAGTQTGPITLTLGEAVAEGAGGGNGGGSNTTAATTAQPGATQDSTSLDNDVQGTADGNGINEGSISDSVVNLTVPTSTNANLYGMILDPHSLLKKTNYARFGANAADVVEFENEDGHLFFANKVVDGKTTFNSKSAALTITNKSYLPVGVSVEATLTAPEGLSVADADFTDVEGAAIYLAIESAETNNGKTGETTSTITSSIATDGTHATPSAFNSEDTDLNEKTVGVAYDNGTGVVTLTPPTGYTLVATSETITAPPENSTTSFYGGTAGAVSVTLSKDGKDSTFTLTMDTATPSDGYSETITLTVASGTVSAPVANGAMALDTTSKKATLTTNLLGNASKYKEHYAGTAEDISGNIVDKYDYTLKDDATDFPVLSFNMTGKINDDSAWDDIKPAVGDLKIDLTWKVTKDTYENPTAGNTSASATGTAPTARVTKAATRIADTATVTYDLGTGTRAATGISKVTYIASGATEASEIAASQIVNDTENHTLTITTIAPVYGGSNWKIVFNDAAATEVAVSLK